MPKPLGKWTGLRSGRLVLLLAGLNLLALPAAAQSNYAAAYTFSTFAGSSGSGSANGVGSVAQFNLPYGVAADTNGNVYVADTLNHTIRQITPAGVVSTIAGFALTSGSADGTNSAARFNTPQGVTVDSAGNVYVADSWNDTIRKLTLTGTNWAVSTIAGSAGNIGSSDGTNGAARFNEPAGIAVDSATNLYVADTYNDTIRKLTPVGTNWVISTIAGLTANAGSADGTNSTARFNNPMGVAVDSAGNVYVADTYNDTIRKLTLPRDQLGGAHHCRFRWQHRHQGWHERRRALRRTWRDRGGQRNQSLRGRYFE